MARTREAGPAAGSSVEAAEAEEREEIKAWYRDRLAGVAVVPGEGGPFPPSVVGPTWAKSPSGGWLLPEFTIGWDAVAWASQNLVGPGGGAWTFTNEQLRFLLWYYATDENGVFLNSTVVLQRCKGWGKDPLAAVVTLVALLGPSVPRMVGGRIVGAVEADPWVRLLAVSQQQTRNTMGALKAVCPPEDRKRLSIRIGDVGVRRTDGQPGFVAAITSNPEAAEGSRATLTVCNETQNWTASNSGLAMMGVVRGDAAKSPVSRQARVLHLCNAAREGVESVGLQTREGWEAAQDGRHANFGLMYDSLEAPPDAPLSVEAAPEVIRAVRGDATWLTPDRIIQDVVDPSTPPSESRRKWYNQTVAAEDSWLSRQEWDSCCDPELPALDPADELCVFFDGGKSDDATALVGCRVTDGAVFALGLWQRPPGARGKGWVAPREQVDARVREVVSQYRVVGLWADPSHTMDDESMEQFWDAVVDGWHRDLGRRLRLKASSAHSVRWDMADPSHTKLFVHAVQRVTSDVLQGALLHDGDARLRMHVLHAKRAPTKWGLSIRKEHRESKKKIDLAVCMVGSRMMREMYLNRTARRGRGKVW